MIKFATLLLMATILTACTTENKDAISKVEEVFENAPADLEVADEEMEEAREGKVQFIEFNLEEENILIDINKVPILAEYLNPLENPQNAIENMSIERLDITNEPIYLLSFSCSNDRCSYLIFHENQEKQPFLLADLAEFSHIILSPDETKVAIQFSRSIEDKVPLNNIVIFDILNWQSLPLYNEELTSNILNFNWPFVSVEWIDEDHLSVSIPEIVELNKESYNEWSSSTTNSVQTVIYQLYED
ncbi:hypothetical protein [Oceanobacillus sp. CAU 1775]